MILNLKYLIVNLMWKHSNFKWKVKYKEKQNLNIINKCSNKNKKIQKKQV